MTWVIANLSTLLTLLGAFTAFMTALASLTPTKTDDKVVNWLDKIGRFADRYGIQLKSPTRANQIKIIGDVLRGAKNNKN